MKWQRKRIIGLLIIILIFVLLIGYLIFIVVNVWIRPHDKIATDDWITREEGSIKFQAFPTNDQIGNTIQLTYYIGKRTEPLLTSWIYDYAGNISCLELVYERQDFLSKLEQFQKQYTFYDEPCNNFGNHRQYWGVPCVSGTINDYVYRVIKEPSIPDARFILAWNDKNSTIRFFEWAGSRDGFVDSNDYEKFILHSFNW